ncbi:MAG TPA: DUF4062 domain-containing protein [Thermoanaerobaculia bacterium]|nr:DUF4062 domain-containing protein [Thermoanaerobaculia bacterium]
MPYSVFLSSTQKDLRPFREAVSRVLKVDGHEVIEMERFGARSDVPLDVCLQEVVNAELFVGIYARRYGFIPRDSACSITEWEYREAKRLQRPCYCYFLREESEWPEELCETGEAAAQLKRFKEQIQEDVAVDVFSTPEELAEKVRSRLKAEVAEAAEEGSGERRFRRDFLNHIEHTCVDWLRQKVPAGQRLRIEKEDCPRAVGKPERETVSSIGPTSLTDGELRPAGVVDPIYDTFRRRSCRLLILGRPGGGKTIALFELCQSLLREARRDLDSRYPLVFNLGSWRWHDQRFETWVRREIEKKYGIGKKKARELVEGDEIVPLLDGLDEVDPESRADCVKAINAYLTRREFTVLSVSCHSQVYEEIPGHAHLEGAVALRPLNPRQIDERLAAGGDPGLAAVREAVAADGELQRLAASPLMLILLERTYRGADPNAVREALGNPAADRRKKVLDEYVSRMLEPDLPWARVEKDRSYPPEKTCRSLSWLAGRMRQHDSEFLIEQIQPAWLPTEGHRLAYAVLSRALAGVLLTAPLALFWGSKLLLFGLLAGILAGALDMSRLRRASAVGEEERTPAQTVRLSLGRALLLGGGVSVLFLAAGWVRGAGQVSGLLMGGALLGPLFGLVLGTRSTGRDGSNDVRIRVKLRIGRWSWRASFWSAASLLLVSLAFWAISFRRPEIAHLTVFWPFIAALATLFGGLMGGALGALEDTPVPKRASPNQGVRWTLLNAGLVALSVAALVGLSLGPLAMFVGNGDEQSRRNLVAVLEAAVVLGFWAGLWFSGLDFVQHYMLRLLLRAAGLLPLRLTHFLSYLTGRGLMQRTGGKYSFESQLLDHFASLPG